MTSRAWTCERLRGMSTATPRRASLYARSPPILTADAAGIGSSISPRRRASRVSTSARDGAGGRSTTSPSGSPVDLVVARPQRHAPRRAVALRRFADQRDHLRPFDCAQRVDDPFRVGLLRADGAEVVLQQIRDDEATAFEELRALEGTREQLQLR